MGFSLLAYLLLLISGSWIFYARWNQQQRPNWLRPFHYWLGISMVALVLLLLAIGVVGTLGYYGNLGHSFHLPVGLSVVCLVLFSAWSATQISPKRPWARPLHVGTNISLLVGFVVVSLTGWTVVQKYLP